MPRPPKQQPDDVRLSPYELVFKATNDVLYDLDLKQEHVNWNEALFTQYGYKESPTIHTFEWWSQHIHPDDALEVEHKIADWLESTAACWETEYRFATADGQYKHVRDRGYVIRAQDGTPERIIGSFLDITQQRQLERAKDEFISLVSHQLRTPLSVIRTYGEMLTNGFFGPVEPEQKTQVLRMTDASVRMIKLVSDILDISKIELNRIAIQPMPTDVNQLIHQSVSEILPVAEEKGVAVSFAPDSAIKSVALDPMIFGQILHNFLTNGVRYTPQGGHVKVSFTRDDNSYTLSVSDDGIGIPKSARPRVFERFYRAKNAANIEEHGTGLGLYMVKLLSEASGGKVWFKSTLAERTIFYFQIPGHGMSASSFVEA